MRQISAKAFSLSTTYAKKNEIKNYAPKMLNYISHLKYKKAT